MRAFQTQFLFSFSFLSVTFNVANNNNIFYVNITSLRCFVRLKSFWKNVTFYQDIKITEPNRKTNKTDSPEIIRWDEIKLLCTWQNPGFGFILTPDRFVTISFCLFVLRFNFHGPMLKDLAISQLSRSVGGKWTSSWYYFAMATEGATWFISTFKITNRSVESKYHRYHITFDHLNVQTLSVCVRSFRSTQDGHKSPQHIMTVKWIP